MTGPDDAGLRNIETFLESPKAQPFLRNTTVGSLRAASIDLLYPNELKTVLAPTIHRLPMGEDRMDMLPRHNRKGLSMPSSVMWYESVIGSPEPLKVHERRRVQTALNRNDFKGTLTRTMMKPPSAHGVYAGVDPFATLSADPGAAKRQADRKTPLRGPKGLHKFTVGKIALPKSHDIVLSITSDPTIAPEDEMAEPDCRFPPGDDQFRIVGVSRRENLRYNRLNPSKVVKGAIRASTSLAETAPYMEETIRNGDMYPPTISNRGGPRILPPDATFSLLHQSLPQGLLKEDRREYHTMMECIKHLESRPATSLEVRRETKTKAIADFTVACHQSYEVGKAGMKSSITKSRLGHGNPVTWKTPVGFSPLL